VSSVIAKKLKYTRKKLFTENFEVP